MIKFTQSVALVDNLTFNIKRSRGNLNLHLAQFVYHVEDMDHAIKNNDRHVASLITRAISPDLEHDDSHYRFTLLPAVVQGLKKQAKDRSY